MNLTVLSVGGSIIAPEKVDSVFLKAFREAIVKYLEENKDAKLILVCGCGVRLGVLLCGCGVSCLVCCLSGCGVCWLFTCLCVLVLFSVLWVMPCVVLCRYPRFVFVCRRFLRWVFDFGGCIMASFVCMSAFSWCMSAFLALGV